MKNYLGTFAITAMIVSSASSLAQTSTTSFATEDVSRDSLVLIEKEKVAIRKVIANETESYYRQDFEAWKSNFVNADYFRQYGYWEGFPEKVKYYNGFDTLQNFKKAQFRQNKTIWKGSYEKRNNENFRIFNDVAWYTFEQDSFDGKTDKFLGRSIELRILEKHEGNWKIAYLGYHYLPLE